MLNRGKKKADQLEIFGFKEWHGGEFPGFSLCFMYFRLKAVESSKLEMPMGAPKSALSQRTKNETD